MQGVYYESDSCQKNSRSILFKRKMGCIFTAMLNVIQVVWIAPDQKLMARGSKPVDRLLFYLETNRIEHISKLERLYITYREVNLMSWRCCVHESHLVTPALTVLTERRNILQCQIILLEVLADNVFSAAVWSAARLYPVCSWWVEPIDDSGRMVISSLQGVTEPAKTALCDGTENVQLAVTPALSPLWTENQSSASSQWSCERATRRHGRGRYEFCREAMLSNTV